MMVAGAEVTDTAHPDQKNIFAFPPGTPYHVGTIISGSRSKLHRFEANIFLIRRAPAMRLALDLARWPRLRFLPSICASPSAR